MMVDTRETGEAPVPEDQSMEVLADFGVTNFLVFLIAASLPLLAALWLFDRKAP